VVGLDVLFEQLLFFQPGLSRFGQKSQDRTFFEILSDAVQIRRGDCDRENTRFRQVHLSDQ